MIVGVTGFFGSGKDSFAEYLVKKKNFEHISLSDMIRQEILKRKQKITRDKLREVGNELRTKYGSGVLALKAIKSMVPEKNYVVTSIRARAEVEVFKEEKEFVLVFVDSPIEVRFKRIHLRNRENDPKTIEELREKEEKEMNDKEGGMQLAECRRIADIFIKNNSTLEEFYKKIDKLIENLKKKFPYIRPSWDEYFLNIVKVIGQRGTCDRGRTGAVLVKNNRILTTGYVGSPPGLPHCDEVGHLFHIVEHTDGVSRVHCVRTIHAEQNAIAQAAKHGVNIDGSTLYLKMTPCNDCAKLIIAAGIKRVVCERFYHGSTLAVKMFKDTGVELRVLKNEIEKYENMKK
ncbi:MAG: deaminase [Candidatus Woesearchaeota archaeon]